MELDLTSSQRHRAALAALLGNALEWYDFAVYGYVASDLGRAFFPAEVPGLQTLAAFGVFAVGYLMRPVGSLLLGPIGDLLGRRLMLGLSIVIMGLSSLLIGLLPTHSQIGVAAGTLLVLLRMVQGFSVGAEFTGSITYATEAAAKGRAGYLSSLAVAGGLLGFSCGSLTAALATWSLGEVAMASWGWRLPFLLGAAVAVLGLWMRCGIPETLSPQEEAPVTRDLGAVCSAVLARLGDVAGQWRLVLQVIGLVSFANVIFYLAFVYLVDLAGQRSGNTAAANTIATVIQTGGLLLAIGGGVLTDRFGMVPVNRWGNVALVLLAPLGLLIGQQGQLVHLAVAELLLVVPVMVTMGAQGVLGVLLVPQRQRCAVFSIAYSLAMALFAGTAPLVATWLAEQQWSALTVPYALIYGAAALITVQRLRHADIR
ncbi:MAG: MFS transporter [Cyanobacteria bacterium REEB417]|nr:MFS transporter [Cyanobacteria bacterium REEB417]